VAVHDIDMDIVGTTGFYGANLIAKSGKIGGQNGRGDLDHALLR
jgi:hypothetical protein